MLKKTIKFTDFDGLERKEDFYFNLTQAEIAEMELSTEGGLVKMVDKMIETKDNPKLVALFKDLILKSYGEKSPDGRKFMKSAEIRAGFEQTQAYSELFMMMLSDDKVAADFVNGIVPQQVQKA